MRHVLVSCLMALAALTFPSTNGWSQSSSEDEGFTMALCGETIISRKLSVYREPEFLEMIEILRSADVAFTNLEMLFHDYEPYPMHASGGSHQRADPAIAKELVWAGFDMVSRANNHTGDSGVLGMNLTTKYVAEAGLVQAGVGNSLAEAREAKFLETAEARVALVACASSFLDFSRAGKTRGDIPPRPGLSALRHSLTYVLPRGQFEMLRGTLTEIGLQPPESGDELTLFGNRFAVGAKREVRTTAHQEDLEEIAAVVRNASRLADYTMVTWHGHQSGETSSEPAEFLVAFSRAMIDAGADIVFGHGPHTLGGIEIYKGKPILYSLGNFALQYETQLRFPHDDYVRHDLGPNAHTADYYDLRLADIFGRSYRDKDCERLAKRLDKHSEELLVFLLHPDVDLSYLPAT